VRNIALFNRCQYQGGRHTPRVCAPIDIYDTLGGGHLYIIYQGSHEFGDGERVGLSLLPNSTTTSHPKLTKTHICLLLSQLWKYTRCPIPNHLSCLSVFYIRDTRIQYLTLLNWFAFYFIYMHHLSRAVTLSIFPVLSILPSLILLEIYSPAYFTAYAFNVLWTPSLKLFTAYIFSSAYWFLQHTICGQISVQLGFNCP